MRTRLLFLGILISWYSVAQEIPRFREGDRVAFVGNSITDGGHYHSFLWLYYMTRLPDERLRIMNAGIGGDRAYDISKRMEMDVFAKRPNVILLTFGMNDSGYFEYNGTDPENFAKEKIAESYADYQTIETRLKALSGTKIILVGSTPYDETAIIEDNQPFRNKNKAMREIVAFQEQSARQNNWHFFDFNRPMTELNETGQKTDPGFTLCGGDRIHPDNDGHMVMAYLMLKAQGFAGEKVAEVRIDAKKKFASTENAIASNLLCSAGEIQFDYLAKALPYPLDTIPRGWGSRKSQAEAIQVVPFMEEMNQELLAVTNLEKGKYVITIDEEVIGQYSSEELTTGINLAANTRTPQYQQALAIMHLNEERWEIERRFRQYAWIQFGFFQQEGLLFANDRRAIEVMDENVEKNIWLKANRDIYTKLIHPEIREVWEKEMDLIIDTIYRINKPISRQVRIKKING